MAVLREQKFDNNDVFLCHLWLPKDSEIRFSESESVTDNTESTRNETESQKHHGFRGVWNRIPPFPGQKVLEISKQSFRFQELEIAKIIKRIVYDFNRLV